MQHVTANGASIPALGFGTFELAPADAEKMVAHALKTGYRHIDTAQLYENEEAVGRGIKASGVPREEIFLTTKVWIDRFNDGFLQNSVIGSLERLDTDYADLVLLHWPNPKVTLRETLGALNQVKKRGMARHIGISNFTSALAREAAAQSDAPLATNQVEYHPYLDQSIVHAATEETGMALSAYCPLARGEVFSDATLKEIAAAHGKNPGQVSLRWLLQQDNVIALPRSSNPDHVTSNFEVFDFELSDDEMAAISALHRDDGRMINPSVAPAWDNA